MFKSIVHNVMTIRKEITAFIFVGMMNTTVGYLLYAFLLFCGIGYVFALLLAAFLGVLFGFHTMGKIVFNNTSRNLLVKFIAVHAFLYLLNVSLIKIFYLMLRDYYWAGLIALIPSSAAAFFLNKYVVFKKKPLQRQLTI